MLDHESRDRLTGIGIAVLGVVVLALAVVALRNPTPRSSRSIDTATRQSHAVAGLSSSSPHRSAAHSAPPPASSSSSSPSTSSSDSSSDSSSPSLSSGATAPSSDAKEPLIVLNNTTTTGLAAGAEARFEAGGWTVTHIGTIKNDILSTCAYYDPSEPGAQAAAEALQAQFPNVKRVQPRFAELPSGPIVVVLTWDYKVS